MSLSFVESYVLKNDLNDRLLAYPKYQEMIKGDVTDNIHNTYLGYIIKGSQIPSFNNNSIDDKFGIWNAGTYQLINKIATDTSLSKVIIDQFLRSLYQLSRTGKIDKRKFDPNYDKVLLSVGTLPSEQGVMSTIQNSILPNAGKAAKVIAVIAVLGIGAFVFHDFTKIKKRV